MNKKTASLLLALTAVTTSAHSSETLQLSLVPDVALHSSTTKIEGLSLNIWGENPQNGLALGLVNGSTGNSSGISYAFLANYADNYTGLQISFVNYTEGEFVGVQWGGVNYTSNLKKGVQLGTINYAKKVSKGIQFGTVNYTEHMTEGLQVGFINIIRNTNDFFTDFPDEVAPIMPIVNWRF